MRSEGIIPVVVLPPGERRPFSPASVKVRAFYERHPYPPPAEDLTAYLARWAEPGRVEAEHHLMLPGEPLVGERTVLVAGCGTQQAAKHALRRPEDRVVGIDVSEAALDGTQALAERHGLGNLEVRRLAVEDAADLARSFDIVVCTGVLHHLEDPDRGLAALASVLRPGGAMRLMVYAPYGRAGVYMLQDYARRLSVGTSSQEIRDLAATLSELPPEHPLRPVLDRSPDFATEVGLADALLHPRDRPYSVPEVLEFIERAGLRFERWVRQAPYLPTCGAPLLTPHAERLAALPAADQYAAMELFRGSMVRHSAIASRGRSAEDRHRSSDVEFDGSAWLDFIPIRLPDTICVEAGVPAGKVGVLINRSHTYSDIYLPIDAGQKRMLDEIDGERSVAMICESINVTPDAARTFFQRLWQYDQVVFDTSTRRHQ